MPKILVAASCLSLILIASKTQSPSIAPNFKTGEMTIQMADQSGQYCSLTIDNRADWSKCIGQRVKIKGRYPTVVAQHVSRNVDPLGHHATHQGYMDALNYQFVLLSDHPIQCRNEFEVEGVLSYFSLGGNTNTKAGYANYEIRVQSFDCLEPSDAQQH